MRRTPAEHAGVVATKFQPQQHSGLVTFADTISNDGSDDCVVVGHGSELFDTQTLTQSEPPSQGQDVLDSKVLATVLDEHELLLQPRGSTHDSTGERCTGLAGFVRHYRFERFMGVIILANSFFVGWETSYAAEHASLHLPDYLLRVDGAFCGIFVVELLLRFAVFGCHFFTTRNYLWNWFDFSLVVVQLMDQFGRNGVGIHVPFLRVLRLFRILRLVRVWRIFEELEVAVHALISNSRALLCALLLLFMVIYMFSILILQAVVRSGALVKEERLRYWFDGLGRTMLTLLECLLGGVSWDEVVELLLEGVSPVLGILCTVFIGVGILAVLNIITAMFTESILKTALEDQDNALVAGINKLFRSQAEAGIAVDVQQFGESMQAESMRSYFKALGMHYTEAPLLFRLLDTHNRGFIAPEDIANGLLGLRGTAKGIDVCVMLRELNQLHERLDELSGEADAHQISESSGKGVTPYASTGNESEGNRDTRTTKDTQKLTTMALLARTSRVFDSEEDMTHQFSSIYD